MDFLKWIMEMLWPGISDTKKLDDAKFLSYYGVGASILCAALTFFLTDKEFLNPITIIASSIVLIIAWGIYRFSRIAAVCGLTLYVFSTIVRAMTVEMRILLSPLSVILFIIVFGGFLNGVRGTFLYHKYMKMKNTA
jgi:hypothetical protein